MTLLPSALPLSLPVLFVLAGIAGAAAAPPPAIPGKFGYVRLLEPNGDLVGVDSPYFEAADGRRYPLAISYPWWSDNPCPRFGFAGIGVELKSRSVRKYVPAGTLAAKLSEDESITVAEIAETASVSEIVFCRTAGSQARSPYYEKRETLATGEVRITRPYLRVRGENFPFNPGLVGEGYSGVCRLFASGRATAGGQRALEGAFRSAYVSTDPSGARNDAYDLSIDRPGFGAVIETVTCAGK